METTTRAVGIIGKQAVKEVIKVTYCLYARKSTESEERQVLSIDSQIKEMLQLAEREGLEVVAMKRESHSAKENGQRPVFNEIMEELRIGKYNGLLTWAPGASAACTLPAKQRNRIVIAIVRLFIDILYL